MDRITEELVGQIATNVGAILSAMAQDLAGIRSALERLAAGQADPDEAPSLERPIGDYKAFDWSTIGATVRATDDDGATIVEWDGHMWKRRSPENQFGAAIWYSRCIGKDETGKNLYAKLITFKPVSEVTPVSRKAEKEIGKAPAVQPTPAATRLAEPIVAPPSRPAAADVATAPTQPPAVADADRQFGEMPSRGDELRRQAEQNTAAVVANLAGTDQAAVQQHLPGTARGTQPEPAAEVLRRNNASRAAIQAERAAAAAAPVAAADGSDYRTAARPWTAIQVRRALTDAVDSLQRSGHAVDPNGLFGATLDCMEQIGVRERKAFLKYVAGVESSKDLAPAWRQAIVRWAKPTKDPVTAEQPNPKWYCGSPHFRIEFNNAALEVLYSHDEDPF